MWDDNASVFWWNPFPFTLITWEKKSIFSWFPFSVVFLTIWSSLFIQAILAWGKKFSIVKWNHLLTMIVVQIFCCYMELFTYNYFMDPWSCLVAFYINDTPTNFLCSSNNGKDPDLRFCRNDFIARVKYVFTKEHEKGKFFYIGTFITPQHFSPFSLHLAPRNPWVNRLSPLKQFR